MGWVETALWFVLVQQISEKVNNEISKSKEISRFDKLVKKFKKRINVSINKLLTTFTTN